MKNNKLDDKQKRDGITQHKHMHTQQQQKNVHQTRVKQPKRAIAVQIIQILTTPSIMWL